MRFLDSDELADGGLALTLAEMLPANLQEGLLPAYRFDIHLTADGTEVGEIGLKIGTPPNHLGHIWYRVFPDYRGNHYAARACRLLIPLARRHGIDPLWITCREENIASRRTCELAGAEFVGLVETPAGCQDWLGPVRQKCKYRLGTSESNR